MNLRLVGRKNINTAFRRRWLIPVGLTLALVAFVSTVALASAADFPDVPSSHPYYPAIADLNGRGIIGGYANGSFGPADPVTRQQFAKMIVLTGGYPVSEEDVCHFTDVSQSGPGSFFPDNYVAVCAANGITTGQTATTFNPSGKITRYQAISMVVRMADNLQADLLVTPPEGWTATGVWGNNATHGANAARAEYNGLLDGLDLASLTPYGNMTRGEVAQVLHNLLSVLYGGSKPPSSGTTTTSMPTTTTTAPSSGGVLATFSGSGDDVLDIQKPQGPALVWIRGNAESRYFGVTSYGPGYEGPYTQYELLANETEPYEGIRLIDYYQGFSEQKPQTTRIEVKAEGAWSIELRSLSTARTVGTPGQIQGTGDDVIRVTGSPSKAHIVGNASSRYFGVTAYYGPTDLYDLLVNETDPYEGTVMFSKANAYLLEVQADDSWSIAIQR